MLCVRKSNRAVLSDVWDEEIYKPENRSDGGMVEWLSDADWGVFGVCDYA